MRLPFPVPACLAFALCSVPSADSVCATAAVGDANEPRALAASWSKLALLIGINEYQAESISALHGCINDVHEMKDLLVGKFDFSPDNVKMLTNREATRAAMIRAFNEHLIDKARAYKEATGNKPIVVFHYSGHGSQVVDTSGDEVDGRDETLVPYDSTKPEEDLLDDQVNELLNELAKITDSVTYILDSCHSGTATRGEGQARLVERVLPPAAGVEVDTGSESSQAYALITGCRSEQRSYEYTDPEGVPHGTLTYFLTREIRASNETQVTYRDVMDKVTLAVNGVRHQTPQLSGAKLDNFVFGDAQSLARPYLRVNPKDGKIVVAAGKAQGLTEKSILAVYAPGTKQFQTPNQPIAEIELTEVKAFESTAKLLSGGPVPEAARAVIAKHAMRANPLLVFLDAKGEADDDAVADQALIATVKAAIQADPLLEDECRFVDAVGDAQLKVAAWKDGTIRVVGRHILSPPVPKADSDAVPRVLAQLKHWAHWFNLKELHNDNSDLHVEFQVEGPDRGKDQDGIRRFHPDDKITISVMNKSAKPVYFAVVVLSSDGSISQLFPQPGVAEELPKASTWNRSTETFLEDGQQLSFDYLKLLVFDEPVDTFFLTTDAAPKAVTRGAVDPLFPFAAAVGKCERGVRPVKPDSWVTSRLELKVVRP